jgi:chromate transport protein ChrA
MPIGLFQILLGALGVFFAHSLGRSAVKLHSGQISRGTTIGWALRTTVCVYAVFYFGGLHWPFVLVLVLALANLAFGVWLESRPKHDEDLSKVMFPHD